MDCVLSRLLLIAQAGFLSERGHTETDIHLYKVTDASATPAGIC